MTKQWRVGRKLGRTLYWGEELVGMMDTQELAAQVVALMNGEVATRIEQLKVQARALVEVLHVAQGHLPRTVDMCCAPVCRDTREMIDGD